MQKTAFHVLRLALAVTFVWIGVSIFRFPEAWGNFIQPWALDLLFIPVRQAMLVTAVLDVLIGVVLLSNRLVWIAALVGAAHLGTVLVVSGITEVTIRDVGLLGACLALAAESAPASLKQKLPSK